MGMQPELMTLDECMVYLRIRRDTLFRNVLPHMPSVRIGGRRLVRRVDLEAWVGERASIQPNDSRRGRTTHAVPR